MARKSEIQICSSLNEDQKSERQICHLPDNQTVEDTETRLRILSLPDNQSVANGETKRQICHLPDFQPVRVVNGGSKGEHGTWAIRPIAIRVAQKLNPDFAVWVDEVVLKLLTKGKVR